MELLNNWKTVLKKAWSVRLILLATLLSGAEAGLPLVTNALPQGVFALLSAAISISAFIARLVVQQGVSEDEDR